MASDDEFSDLTDLESEDDDIAPKKRGRPSKKSTKSSKGGYRIRNALKVPRATTYTAQALYDQIISCDINLEPEYQRDVVWTETKQIGIIDSVFRNFYIPPVIFAVNVYEDGSETKTCIDGKQRLTSIHKFMDGLIPRKHLIFLHLLAVDQERDRADKDPFTGEKLYYKDINPGKGPKRQILPEKYRRVFANKQIVCVEYQDITDSDEREIFQRVQLGMALTPAEKLQVIKTPRADFIRELQNTHMKDDGWLGPTHLVWEVTRGGDYRGLAQAVCLMDTFTAKAAQISVVQLEKWLSAEAPLKPNVQAGVEQAFEMFVELVQNEQLNHVFSTPVKLSPVEFIGISLFLFAHKDKATLLQLHAGIIMMRADLRDKHLDIRLNSRVSKTVLEFIRAWKPSKVNGDTGNTATQRKASGVKRKRASKKPADDDDDDDDDAMDVDEEGDNNMHDAPKAKKSATTQMLMNAKASASNLTARPSSPPRQIKAEPAATVPISYPATDRIAALRRAKETIAQGQAERATQLPSRQAVAPNTAPIPNPQMLPSPNQAYARTPAISGTGSSSTAMSRPLESSSTLGSSLMATMMRSTPAVASSSRPNDLPPPPTSGASSITGSEAGIHNSARDRDRDRDYDRSRDYDRDRSRGRERSRDRDRYRDRSRERDRYDTSHDRRDSGSYSQRPPRYDRRDSRY